MADTLITGMNAVSFLHVILLSDQEALYDLLRYECCNKNHEEYLFRKIRTMLQILIP